MSKEQTSITARVEWIAKRVDISEHTKLLISFKIKEAVLEALEREVNTAFVKGGKSMADFLTGSTRMENYTNIKKTYYETQVKPKYNYKSSVKQRHLESAIEIQKIIDRL